LKAVSNRRDGRCGGRARPSNLVTSWRAERNGARVGPDVAQLDRRAAGGAYAQQARVCLRHVETPVVDAVERASEAVRGQVENVLGDRRNRVVDGRVAVGRASERHVGTRD